MASKTDRRQNGWSEYQYTSEVHGGCGYYWERDKDGLRVSMRTSGRYYPPGEAVKVGRPPRTRTDIGADEVPGQISGNMYDPIDLSEHVMVDMRTKYEGAHVRFAYQGEIMHTIGEDDFEENGIELNDDGYPSMKALIEYAGRMWPVGKESMWPKSLGIKAELS